MKITTLIENLVYKNGLLAEHGLVRFGLLKNKTMKSKKYGSQKG